MQELRTPTQEAAEDLFFGQVVIIIARYFLIATALVNMVFTLEDPSQLALAVIPVVALLVMNFFLHGRYLIEQPAGQALVLLTSVIDLFIVTLLVIFWGGINSPFFVFYYPIVVAFAFVVPRRLEVGYTTLAVVAYGAACLGTDPSLVGDVAELKVLILRLITIAAAGGLANYYFRIQRIRRRAIAMGQPMSEPAAISEPD